MALFRLQISSISRHAGRRATAAAAYRAGARIRDERSGELHNYTRRKDVLHTEILLPAHLAGQSAEWARDRSKLWNAAEHAETRRIARVAREFQVTLPAELSNEQRVQLARAFSQEVADRYRVAVDLAVHEPRPDGDSRNFHAHLLLSTREVTPAGFAAKVGLDMSSQERERLGLLNGSQEFTAIRKRWADLTNDALQAAQIDARVDHRSLHAQGIDREPGASIPLMSVHMERDGLRSEVAERIRAQYAARLQSRDRIPAARQSTQAQAPEKSVSLEEVRRQARETWLASRGAGAGGPVTIDRHAQSMRESQSGRDPQSDRNSHSGPDPQSRRDATPDDDLSI